jgi:hypothetical protein
MFLVYVYPFKEKSGLRIGKYSSDHDGFWLNSSVYGQVGVHHAKTLMKSCSSKIRDFKVISFLAV